MRRFTLASLVLLFLTACAGRPDIDEQAATPELNLEEYFEGQTRAYGQFQDILGNVSRRFTVDITGTWDGETLVLVEDFDYSDGTTEQRIWTLAKTGPETWEGTAPGVIGVATGREQGHAFQWQYRIDLPIGDGETLRVGFDDYMWLQPDGRLLNRAYMSRFGLPVGEVIIWFEQV
ncbi:MAG: DUF3833 domain-containing protein [Pseudomonadota bacterium]